MHTPWGTAQHKTVIARGIIFYGTARHGGFHVSSKLNASMPDALRNEDGWYEEDCEYAKVVLAFPRFFNAEQQKTAKDTLRIYYPHAYEAFTGVKLQPGESRAKDEEDFYNAHLADYVAISASSAPGGFVNVLAAIGGRKQVAPYDWDEATAKVFRVPREDYDAWRKNNAFLPFVVELGKYEEAQ